MLGARRPAISGALAACHYGRAPPALSLLLGARQCFALTKVTCITLLSSAPTIFDRLGHCLVPAAATCLCMYIRVDVTLGQVHCNYPQDSNKRRRTLLSVQQRRGNWRKSSPHQCTRT